MSILGTISDITIYPIKSFSGIKLNKAIITKYGIAHPDYPEIQDRKWMVVDENGSFLAQRQIPKMALVKPVINDNGLFLTAPGKDSIKIPFKYNTNKKIKCRVFNLSIDGHAYSQEINDWISEFIEKENCFLVTFAEDIEPRQVKLVDRQSNKGRDDDLIMYPDYSPLMLISENSLNELNKRLEKKVDMRNFRPNFTVKDCEAFAEDDWFKINIGESELTKVKHCTRCLLVTVDQDKGIKDPNQEPLKTLKEFRTNHEVYGVAPMFGINLAPDNTGHVVSLGDKIMKRE